MEDRKIQGKSSQFIFTFLIQFTNVISLGGKMEGGVEMHGRRSREIAPPQGVFGTFPNYLIMERLRSFIPSTITQLLSIKCFHTNI